MSGPYVVAMEDDAPPITAQVLEDLVTEEWGSDVRGVMRLTDYLERHELTGLHVKCDETITQLGRELDYARQGWRNEVATLERRQDALAAEFTSRERRIRELEGIAATIREAVVEESSPAAGCWIVYSLGTDGRISGIHASELEALRHAVKRQVGDHVRFIKWGEEL